MMKLRSPQTPRSPASRGHTRVTGVLALVLILGAWLGAPAAAQARAYCNVSDPQYPTPNNNPGLTLGCGKDVILVIDESRSISNPTNYRRNVMRAARAFVQGLVGTGSRVVLVEFGTRAREVRIPNHTPGTYVPVTNGTLPDLFFYLTDSNSPTSCSGTYNPAVYSPYSSFTSSCNFPGTSIPAGYTNWEGALELTQQIGAREGVPDFVVFLTDGNPTVNNSYTGGPATCPNSPSNPGQSAACVDPAEVQANAIKGAGVHILGVFAGSTSSTSVNNLQAITGCDTLPANFTTAQLLAADYAANIGFDQLENALRRLAFGLCSSSVNVTKLIDADGPAGPLSPSPAEDVLFRGEVGLTTTTPPNAYEWTFPQAATGCPPGTPPPGIPLVGSTGLGCPGPGLAGTVGQVQQGRTRADGTLGYQWTAGTVASPTAEGAQFRLRELLDDVPGYPSGTLVYRETSCTRQRLTDAGVALITSFRCERGNTSCVGGSPSCDGVTCGDIDSGQGILMPVNTQIAADILSCEVINDQVLLDFGDAPDSYGTRLASNGARHAQVPGLALRLGAEIDTEPDGNAGVTADQDDVNPLGSPDDEDGVTFQSFAGAGFPIEATVTGSVGSNPAYLCAYLDGAANGTIDGTFTRSVSYSGFFTNYTGTASSGNEEICVGVQGTGATSFVITRTNIPQVSGGFNGAEAQCTTTQATATFSCRVRFNPNFTSPAVTYARFRLTTDPRFDPLSPNSPSPTGAAINGEVEDYLIPVNPTAVTIGSVALTAQTAEGFLADLGGDGLDAQALRDLLAAWDPAAAEALAGADRAAILAALRAYLDPDGDGQVAVLRWDTLEQRGTIGFYVDRDEDGGDRVRISGDMLPALIGAPLGGEYRLADPTARAGVPYEYTLIEQEAQGSTRSYGPFRLELGQ